MLKRVFLLGPWLFWLFCGGCKVYNNTLEDSSSELRAVYDSKGYLLHVKEQGDSEQLAFEVCSKAGESFEALEGSCVPAFRSSTGASLEFSSDELKNIMSEEERQHMEQVVREFTHPSDSTLAITKDVSLAASFGMLIAGFLLQRGSVVLLALIPGGLHLVSMDLLAKRSARRQDYSGGKGSDGSYQDYLGMGVRWHAAISRENKEVKSVVGFLRDVGLYLKANLESAKTLTEYCYPSSAGETIPRCLPLSYNVRGSTEH